MLTRCQLNRTTKVAMTASGAKDTTNVWQRIQSVAKYAFVGKRQSIQRLDAPSRGA